MSIIITNITPERGPQGVHEYEVRINNGPALARFEHTREHGLARCLRAAAMALENDDWAAIMHGFIGGEDDSSTKA